MKAENRIKVLIISHNPFSTYQSMGKTFLSLFSSFQKEELCQLYVYPSFPNVDAVKSCYRITDRDAIKAIVPGLHSGGEVIPHEYMGDMIENRIDRVLYAKKSNNFPMQRIVRDIVWGVSHWYSRELDNWLINESPNCIFLAPGYAKFIYDIALKISKERHIPIITYICDDYYFKDTFNSVLSRCQHKLLQKKIRQIMKNSKVMIAISEEIKTKYSEEFSIDCELLMTGSDINISQHVTDKQQIKSFSYFGNIGLKRETSLAKIGQILDEINQERNTNYRLKIHTGAHSTSVESAFRGIKSVQICRFLIGEEFVHEFTNADCLVHVEAFDQDVVNLVSGSISTKIADSLASGIPLLAYAPSGIASTEHLRKNECAFIANDYKCLKNVLYEILDNGEKRRRIAKNAICTANRYHVSSENSARLRVLFERIVGKKFNK